MKTLPVIIFVSAIAGLAVLALQSLTAFAALFVAGLISVALADYGSEPRRLPVARPLGSAGSTRAPSLRLAA